jgi:Uri superfamily endonuclease
MSAAATMIAKGEQLKRDSQSSNNHSVHTMDEDTDHSLRPDYLSATLLQGHNIANTATKNMIRLPKTHLAPPTAAIMNLQIHSQDQQEKASWDNLDSIHSRASTVVTQTTLQHDSSLVGEAEIDGFNESCDSFASFGESDDNCDSSSFSMSTSKDNTDMAEERAQFKQLGDDEPSTSLRLLLDKSPSTRSMRGGAAFTAPSLLEMVKEKSSDDVLAL